MLLFSVFGLKTGISIFRDSSNFSRFQKKSWFQDSIEANKPVNPGIRNFNLTRIILGITKNPGSRKTNFTCIGTAGIEHLLRAT